MLSRDFDPSDNEHRQQAKRLGGVEEVREARAPGHLGSATLACPRCDAPTALPLTEPGRGVSPADAIACPYCARRGRVRHFLTLTDEPRPMRVELHIRLPLRTGSRRSDPVRR